MKSTLKATGLVFGLAFAFAGQALAADLKMMTGPQGGVMDSARRTAQGPVGEGGPGHRQSRRCLAPASPMCAASRKARPISASRNSISTVDAIAATRRSTSRTTMSATSRRSIRNISSSWCLPMPASTAVADLKGKSITTQQRGNTGEADHPAACWKRTGSATSDVKMSFVCYTDSVNQMKDGHAVAFGSHHPDPGRRGHGSGRGTRHQAAGPVRRASTTCASINPATTLVTRAEGHLSEAGQGRAGDRLLHAHRGVVQAAGGHGLQHDQGDRRQHQDTGDRRQGDRQADARRAWRQDIGVPFHPGAAKFYKEAGVR